MTTRTATKIATPVRARRRAPPKITAKSPLDPRASVAGRVFDLTRRHYDEPAMRIVLRKPGGVRANVVTIGGCAFLCGLARMYDDNKLSWVASFMLVPLDDVSLMREIDDYAEAISRADGEK